ncbi:MAG: hypothetical protein CMJ18_05195 [Phycisphaeraceae bacterium]|nr:hypothetical protein [Phycisphaeraceae bacterium]
MPDNSRPLEVDQFPSTLVIEPRNPVTYEMTLTPGADERQLYIVGFEYELGGGRDSEQYKAKAPRTPSEQNDAPTGEADLSTVNTAPRKDYIYLTMRSSEDAGRTWSDPWEMRDASGERVKGNHQSVFRMNSGRLGIVYNDHDKFPNGHPTRDNGSGMMFRSSEDEGRTWSEPAVVFPMHAMCCAGHAIVLDSGRIVAPSYRWISFDETVASEADNHLSFSFVMVSDDEGRTWQHSRSELFVCNYRVCYALGEPSVVPLRDGRLMMDLRSEHGRRYRSFSHDQGITWERPRPVLQLASSAVPSSLRRMPSGEILLVWNQAARGEILKGLHRARLSCAVSRDEGETWENFRNLESLDDETVIPPLPADWLEIIEQREDYWYHQPPANSERYHRAPGVLRICYPDVQFVGDEAVFAYDFGWGIYGRSMTGTKVRSIPLGYLRGD